jgi:hypothetical protein
VGKTDLFGKAGGCDSVREVSGRDDRPCPVCPPGLLLSSWESYKF